MKFTKKLSAVVTGTVVAAAIGLGSMASAAAPADVAVRTASTTNVQAKCDREPAITQRYDHTHANITKRIANLQTRHDKAVAAGHEKIAKRLQRVIDRLEKLDQRITTKYDKYETWVQANCNG